MCDVIYSIDEIRDIITPIIIGYGAKKVFLFGSYARESAASESDIDLKIGSGAISSLFSLCRFY